MTPLLWATAALAQTPALQSPSPLEPEPVDMMEVTVWGELAIDQAEDALVAAMEGLGYQARRKGERIVFRPPRAWMGGVVFEDGNLRFRNPVAGFQTTPTENYTYNPARETGALDPSGRSTQLSQAGPSVWVLPDKRKRRVVEREVRTAVDGELTWYLAVVARTDFEQRIEALPDQLDRVWNDGVPLSGDDVLDTPEARRKHVLEYWATRADNPQGQRVCKAVAAWLDDVVQDSDHPITDQERAAYEGRRDDVLRLP